MTQEADVHALVAEEYLGLADLLEGLPEASWETPSLCEGWRVREVVAHLVMPDRYDEEQFMAELAARDFDFHRLSDDLAAKDGQLPRAELVASLRSSRLHDWAPPGGGPRHALNHVVIHGLDSTVPLGAERRGSEAALQVVLDDLTDGGVHEHFGTTVAGHRFEATDLDWSWGTGAPLRAPAAHLALLLCGRMGGRERLVADTA